MPGESTLEKFRRRMEHGVNEYNVAGGRLHEEVAGPMANLNMLCEGMALTAGRYLRKKKCHIEREVMPYNRDANSFVVRHTFFKDDESAHVDVTFSPGHMTYNGQQHALSDSGTVEDAVADAVLSFYLPR